jgi:DcaP outer membrane protein
MIGYINARTAVCATAFALAIGAASPARAQGPTQGTGQGTASGTGQGTGQTGGQGGSEPANAEPDLTMEIYGFAMMDMLYDVEQNDPNWFDVVRPTKLPAFHHEFGEDGHTWAGVRQSRLGVKATKSTSLGDLNTTFEFDLFGVGPDAGQTTFRLRKAWGELGHFGAGQTDSVFMDGSTFPNTIEYWGPNGMVYFLNVQFRWTPYLGDNEVAIALERPGASGDAGIFARRIELQNVLGRFPLPDLTAHYRATRSWGHVQVAGIVRDIVWDDVLEDQFDLSGRATGWGINATSNVKFDKDTLHLGVVYGSGIENYMNDAPIDVGTEPDFFNRRTPVRGKALPVLGVMAFYDHTWNDKWTSSTGYSSVDIDTSAGQLPADFKFGQYSVTNLLYYPATDVMLGGEFQWGRRENNSDGWMTNDYRVQFSFKYNFAYKLGG